MILNKIFLYQQICHQTKEDDMKNQIIYLIFFVIIFNSGCKNSTHPDNNTPPTTVFMRTDSLQYLLSSDLLNINIQIKNSTDSTLVFPSCGRISKRIDVKQGNVWSKGWPDWYSPCPAIFLVYTYIESDSSYFDHILIDTTGTFRVVTIYGRSIGFYPDTLISNEFIVK